MKVLVVEDDEFTRTLLLGAVASLGHDCMAAVDGLHAWSHIQTSVPDVVISGWLMPGLDGLGLCEKVRGLERRSPTYFLLLTAGDDRQDVLGAMEAGVDDYLRKPVDLEELQGRLVLAQRWVDTYRELAARRDELEILNVALRESAERDPLTRTYNRLRLTEDLRAAADRASRYGHRYAFVLLDLDHFKSYNDTYGHIAGDEALIHTAEVILGQARAGDSVYRFGGEEFLLVLPEQDLEGARTAAERIREVLAVSPVRHAHLDVYGHVTVSIGVAVFDGASGSFEAGLQRADAALYRAKTAGRNQTVVADAGHTPSS